MGKKTGVLGGTFNPVHRGHLLLAQAAFQQAGLDQVLFMPSGISYMKRGQYILPAAQRVKLLELSVRDNPFFRVCDMEIRREGYTYTYETMETLKRADPAGEYYFICGADSLYSVETWKYPERIFGTCVFLAAVREDTDRARLAKQAERLRRLYRADVRLLAFARTDISSTGIRERIAAGKSIEGMVMPEAEKYIREHRLFADQNRG